MEAVKPLLATEKAHRYTAGESTTMAIGIGGYKGGKFDPNYRNEDWIRRDNRR